jgi:hypothetical protein
VQRGDLKTRAAVADLHCDEDDNGKDGYFASSLEHLLSELEIVGLLIKLQAERVRPAASVSDEYKGMVMSEHEVDELLAKPPGRASFARIAAKSDLLEAAIHDLRTTIARRAEESRKREIELRLVELQRKFQLTEIEKVCLLVCLAAETDLRYERIYGYLQDDMTKKYPSVDLVLNLACQSFEEKLRERARVLPGSKMLRHGLLLVADDPARPSATLLNQSLRLDERIMQYLLGADDVDSRIVRFTQIVEPARTFDDLVLPAEMKRRLAAAARNQASDPATRVLYFKGDYGYGRKSTAEALCRVLSLPLVLLDLETTLGSQTPASDVIFMLAVRSRSSSVWSLRGRITRNAYCFGSGNWEPPAVLCWIPGISRTSSNSRAARYGTQ